MKLKTSRAPARKLGQLTTAAAALVASASFAQAQVLAGDTFSYFYGDTGSTTAAGGTFDFAESAPGGFSSTTISHSTGQLYIGDAGLGDGAIQMIAGPNSANNNRQSSIWSLGSGWGNNIGTGDDGSIEVITSVTLWVNINFIGQASNLPISLGIYDATAGYTTGTGGAPIGAPVGTTQALSTTGWVGIDIPVSLAQSGFIISAMPGDTSGGAAASSQSVAIYSTHPNSTAARTPGFSVETVMIPEPSFALLSGLGAFLLLGRRRA